jgi:NAD-dependent DNA ligase
MLESIGVKLTSAVSKNTDYLVVKDKETIEENTGKVQKANELEIKIITKDALLKLIN